MGGGNTKLDISFNGFKDKNHRMMPNQISISSIRKYGLTNEVISILYSKFHEIDINHSGDISKDEFMHYFHMKNSLFLERAFELQDKHVNGSIDFNEFCKVISKFCRYNVKDLICVSFAMMDVKHIGEINIPDIISIVDDIYGKKRHHDPQIQTILQQLILNGDGTISLTQFYDFCCAHPLLILPAYEIQQQIKRKIFGHENWSQLNQQTTIISEKEQHLIDLLKQYKKRISIDDSNKNMKQRLQTATKAFNSSLKSSRCFKRNK